MDLSSSTASSAFTADNALKILTPFWDVILKYITNAIMLVAFGSLPIQAAKDSLACVVVVNCPNTTTSSLTVNQLDGTKCEVLNQVALSTFLNQACYYTLHLTDSFFVFILCCEAFSLFFASNIWTALYPKSSLTLSHFITVVSECYDCIGTDEEVRAMISPVPDNGNGGLSAVEDNGNGRGNGGLDEASRAKIPTIKDKVKKFCDYQEKNKFLFYLYLFQQVLQVAFSFAIACVNLIYFRSFDEKFKCSLPKDEFLPIEYNYISCYRYIVPFNELVSHIFTGFVILYFVVALAVLCGIVWKMNRYADKWSKTSDLDFLCLLLRQYSSNQYDRFELFARRSLSSSQTKALSQVPFNRDA